MLTITALAVGVLTALYVFYLRRWHPLAQYPGPFWASITDFWGANVFRRGKHPIVISALHEQYGPVVRIGPNRLSFISEDAINTIFVKGYKIMPKTEFYDAFGSRQFPNLFNQTNMAAHATRRKYLLKIFSTQTVTKWEPTIDKQIDKFRAKLRHFSETGESFDIKNATYQLCCDFMAVLMYGQDFGIQVSGMVQRLPDDHSWTSWGITLGSTPAPFRWLLPLLFLIPQPQTKYKRNVLSFALESQKIKQQRRKDIEAGVDVDRADCITRAFLNNMNEKTESGETPLTEWDVAHELLGFVFAGIHPPAASLALLLWNLLHNPECVTNAKSEIDQCLPAMAPERSPYSLADVDKNLPMLKACIKESFRITPAFAMPLTREVVDNETIVNGKVIPKGTHVSVTNHAFHHNSALFGQDHNMFKPQRWDGSESSERLGKLLMHFGAGGRQCIGKTLAYSILHKVAATLLAEFDLELADSIEQAKAVAGGFKGILPPIANIGISDVKGPIMVKATMR